MNSEDAQRRERILKITVELVTARVAAGEVDPDHADLLKVAVRRAAKLAKAAYDAAVEYTS